MAPKRVQDKSNKETNEHSDDNVELLKLQNENEALKRQLEISDRQYIESQDRAGLQLENMAEQIRILQAEKQISEQERSEVIKQYQEELNEIVATKEATIEMLKDNFRQKCMEIEERYQTTGRGISPDQNEGNINSQRLRESQGKGNAYDVPFPRQLIFDGKISWDSFVKPFESLARSCLWTEEDKLFRLVSSLRGDGAEYAFNQLSQQTLQSYEALKYALEVRFKERRTASSYLNELEGRKYQAKEKLSEYAADIRRLVIKGYPTANEETRETISVRYFLKGLADQQMAVTVGMKEPKTVNEAREMVETYNSLKDDVNRMPKMRAVQAPSWQSKGKNFNGSGKRDDRKYVTESEIDQIVKNAVKDALKQQEKLFQGNKRNRSKANVECYKCHAFGHYASECDSRKVVEEGDNRIQENLN